MGGVNSRIENVKAIVSGGDHNYAVFIQSGVDSAVLNNVTAIAKGTNAINYAIRLEPDSVNTTISNSTVLAQDGWNVGVSNNSSAKLTLHRIEVMATGGSSSMGLDLGSSEVKVLDSNIEAKDAYGNTGISCSGRVHVDRSTVISSGTAVSKGGVESMFIGGSRLEGTVSSPVGLLKCVASYNGDYDPLDSACQ